MKRIPFANIHVVYTDSTLCRETVPVWDHFIRTERLLTVVLVRTDHPLVRITMHSDIQRTTYNLAVATLHMRSQL